MTPKERLLTVFRGKMPDRVPWFADLSYWFAAENHSLFMPISTVGRNPAMINLHRRVGAGIYLNTGPFWDVFYKGEVYEQIDAKDGIFRHLIKTPLGIIEEILLLRQERYMKGVCGAN